MCSSTSLMFLLFTILTNSFDSRIKFLNLSFNLLIKLTSSIEFKISSDNSKNSLVSIFVFSFIVEFEIHNFSIILIYTFLGSFILSSIGIIIGLWAEKFDHMASATNFIIVPLSFLSGTFYSIDRLPDILRNISEMNPFFYIIDGFRYGFLGAADGSIQFGFFYLLILSFITWFAAYMLFKKGYKIKS